MQGCENCVSEGHKAERSEVRPVFLEGELVDLVAMVKKRHSVASINGINRQDLRLPLTSVYPIGEVAEREWLIQASSVKPDQVQLAIETKEGRHVGNVGLMEISSVHRTAEIGVVVFDPEDRGQGYGLEACKLLIEHGFKYLDLYKVYASVVSGNAHSLHMCQKLGACEEGRQERHLYRDGRRMDKVMLAFFRDEWLLLLEAGKLPLIVGDDGCLARDWSSEG